MSDLPQRIVYVDDDNSMRFVVREAFERLSPELSVVTCGTGAELLNRLRELQPDILLLDLKMPGMSGPDLLHELRKRPEGADLPVVFITAVQKIEMIEKYQALGVIGVVVKPFDVTKLAETIGRFWYEHRNSKTLAGS